MTHDTAQPRPIGPVAVLDPMSEAMQQKVRRCAEGLDLRFAPSASDEDFSATVKGARYIVTRSHRLPAQVLRQADAVKLLHQWGTGFDGLPLEAAREMGVSVARSPGVNAPTVADLTVGLMLCTLRRLPQLHIATQSGDWSVSTMVAGVRDLTGRSVGLVGFGAIGQTVAKRLRGFECDVVYTRQSGPLENPDARYVELNELLESCDVVSLHLPLTTASHHMIGAAQLARMRPGSTIINTSRGGLIDEMALIDALQTGHLGAAGLDVFEKEPTPTDNPLLGMPNVVTLPHVGGRTEDNLDRMVRHWAGNIREFEAGQDLDPACMLA